MSTMSNDPPLAKRAAHRNGPTPSAATPASLLERCKEGLLTQLGMDMASAEAAAPKALATLIKVWDGDISNADACTILNTGDHGLSLMQSHMRLNHVSATVLESAKESCGG